MWESELFEYLQLLLVDFSLEPLTILDCPLIAHEIQLATNDLQSLLFVWQILLLHPLQKLFLLRCKFNRLHKLFFPFLLHFLKLFLLCQSDVRNSEGVEDLLRSEQVRVQSHHPHFLNRLLLVE